MGVAAYKRIKLSSARQLDAWLAKSADAPDEVLFVTHADPGHPEHVSRDVVARMLASHGWVAGRRFTVTKHLLGHVASRA